MSAITAVSSLQLYKLQPINREDKPSGGPFDKAFDTLTKQMEHLSKEAQAYYDTLESKTKLSQEATDQLQNFNSAAAKEFLNKNYPQETGNWDDKSDEQLKEGLENFKTSQTDFVAESQLKIQRVMQTYNTTASLMNSLQAMLADLNKSIIQKL